MFDDLFDKSEMIEIELYYKRDGLAWIVYSDEEFAILKERKAIQVIDESLLALMSNSWLLNNGIEQCTDQFTEILNPTQMSKFLLWADHNSEAIDELDYVNAPPANASPGTSPSFVFGIDEMNAGEDG